MATAADLSKKELAEDDLSELAPVLCALFLDKGEHIPGHDEKEDLEDAVGHYRKQLHNAYAHHE